MARWDYVRREPHDNGVVIPVEDVVPYKDRYSHLEGEMWGSFDPDTETLYLYTKSARLLCIGKDEVVAPDTPRSQQRPEASDEPPSDDGRG